MKAQADIYTREIQLQPKIMDYIDSLDGELIRSHGADGPFVLGDRPSYADFTIAGSLQSARVVNEGVVERIFGVVGFREVYEACLPYMERKD